MAYGSSTRIVACLALVLSCGPSRGQRVPSSVGDEDITLGAGDVFEVRVYGEEDLSSTYRVSPDGSIDFPLAGRIEVAGAEPSIVANRIAEELRTRQILVDPQVSVRVEEYNSKRVSVMGAVARAGTLPMSEGLSVVEAISQAGGFTPLANRNDTTLTRLIDGEPTRFRVLVDQIARGREPDVPLRAGDIVYVPERVF